MKIKTQSSLEFLLILSAISALSLAALSIYGKEVAYGKDAASLIFNGINSSQINYSTTYPDNPGVSIYVPINSSAYMKNRMQIIAYGCESGSASAHLSSTSMVFSENAISAKVNGISIIGDYFEPLSVGNGELNVSYAINCTNKNLTGSESFSTYSRANSTSESAPLSFYMTDRNESERYPMETGALLSASQFNHCTYVNFFGNPYGVGPQCGTPDAWDFRASTQHCYQVYVYTITYCVVPEDSGYNISSVEIGNATYIYYFTMHINSGYGDLLSSISSSSRNSEVTLNGSNVGNASVSDVFSQMQPLYTEFISKDTSYASINSSAYEMYSEDKNGLYSELGFYNSTQVSYDTVSQEDAAVSAYLASVRSLIGSNGSVGAGCAIYNDTYTCKPNLPFEYVINVTLSKGLGIGNETLSYEGSIVNIKEASN